ncbi:unnamed protein product [Rhodiola kirilowii]
MCIAAFIWLAHPLYPLILLDNRDEYHSRPTKAVAWWDGGRILGGRDEVAGGTWLACSRAGRVALLTNVLELHIDPGAKSRGELPARFLQGTKSPREFAEEMAKEAHEYNGFNLVVADIPSKTMVYISNRLERGDELIIRGQEVSPGIHVLSNAKLDSPWPKAVRLREKLKEMLEKQCNGEVNIPEMVEELLKDTTKADIRKLPGICSAEWEHALSSIFVEVDTPLGLYGTRSMAAMAIERSGQVSYYEKYIEDEIWKEKCFSFK